MAPQRGAVRRQRKVDIIALGLSLLLGFSEGRKRSLTGIRRAYEKTTRIQIAPSAFYSVWTSYMMASAKLCMVMNVVSRGPRTIKLSHGSRHGVKTVAIGPWVKKKLLIFELGYFQGTYVA
jgi:hypothetical protein